MAHESLNISRSRRTANGPGDDRESRSGRARGSRSGSSHGEASSATKNPPHSRQEADGHGVKAATPAKASDLSQEPQKDHPTPPIDVPYTELSARRRYQDHDMKDIQDTMDSDRGDTYHENDKAHAADTSAGHIAKAEQPKLQVRTRPHSRSLLAEIAKERSGETPDAGYISRRERSAAMQVPSLVDTVPEEAVDIVPPLSESLKGSSPPVDDILTPSERNLCDSPLAASPSQSPASASSSWYSRKYGTGRPSSVRRTSRRTNATPVSASPAAEFLRNYSSSSTPKVPDPDSEGVEVGDYVLGRQIGNGGFSQVREAFTATSRSATPTLAVKIVRKQIKGQTEAENELLQSQFEHELEIWRPLQHSNILQLHDSIATQFATFAFMPLVAGGTLWDAVKATQGQGLEMNLAKKYAAQLVQALRYLHQDMRLVHRDIKLENCLLDDGYFQSDGNSRWRSSADAYPRLLLADFGLAEYIPSAILQHDTVSPASPARKNLSPEDDGPAGSMPYTAPEMLTFKRIPALSPKVDIWAFGVLLFAMITGRMPFHDLFQPKLVELIKDGVFDREHLKSCIARGQDQGCHRDTNAEGGEEPSGRSSIFRNESWARSVRTVVPTEGVPIDGDSVMEVIDACLNTRPHERWDVAQLIESSWLVSEVRDGDEDGLEITSR